MENKISCKKTFDDLINEIDELADKEFNKEECREVFAYIKILSRLDDKKLRDTVDKYIKSSQFKLNEQFAKTLISTIQSFKFDENPLTIPNFPYSFIYIDDFISSFINQTKKGQDKLKWKNSISRIMLSLQLKTLISELKNDPTFSLRKDDCSDILETMYRIGRVVGTIYSVEDLPPEVMRKDIHSFESGRHVKEKRWSIKDSIEEIIKLVAESRYKVGDQTLHNEMAKDLLNKLTQIIQKLTITPPASQPVIDEQLFNELDRLMDKHPKWRRPEVINKIPKLERIRKILIPIADKYDRVRGITGVEKIKKVINTNASDR